MQATVLQETNSQSDLAIDGGPRVRYSPMPVWPFFDGQQIAAATAVLQSGKVNYWTGEEGRKFEREFAKHCETEYAVALANGTVALELALLAYGIGDGDEVITTSRTFIASASSAVMRGAIPVMVDVHRDSQNITANTIRAAITKRTKAIIAVHLAGWPCDMDPIMALAKEHNLIVIEDCAQAHGARYKGKPVGSLGHCAAFSFCQDKIITTGGEGGMLVTNDQKIWNTAWSYKDHGKSFNEVYRKDVKPGFRWLHASFGTNWRLTEFQSTIGRTQLEKLNEWVEVRRSWAHELALTCKGFTALRTPLPGDDIKHSYYRFYTFVEPKKLTPGWNRDRIMQAIAAEGVPCFSGSCSEIYREQAFTDAGFGPKERLPVAQELGETSLTFLTHPTLSREDIRDMCRAIEKVMAVAGQG